MRRLLLALVVAALLAPAAVPAATAPKAPKSGSVYRSGAPSSVFLRVAGRSVEIVAISVPCDGTLARGSLNGFRLKRTPKGYRFNADAHGLIGFADEAPDENGALHVSGRFTRDAKRVRGHIRVRSPRCGDTGDVDWRAKKS